MRRILLNSIALALPILLLAGAETVLRLIDYGGDMRAVVVVEREGKAFYTMNQRVGTRYFGVDRLYYQKGVRDFFDVEKGPNTLRVFLLGASTTAGFPYEYQATPAWLLHDRLAATFPDKKIEVINTAMTAVNSYVVADLVKELVDYAPDLFIVYMGQNEFYGLFGAGSTQSIGKQRWLVKSYLWLLRFKTTHLIRDLLYGEGKATGGEGNGPTTMEQMAGRSIRYGDADYQAALRAFEANYTEIVQTAQRHGVPVLLSTLVANEKDLDPFVSFHSVNLPDADKARWEESFAAGELAEQEGRYEDALAAYEQAAAIDSLPARLHYRLGKTYTALGFAEKAREAFVRARDLDGLRFRAPSEFDSVVRKIADAFDVPLADIGGAFREHSPGGSPGKELLWEHVHPNLDGYFLMAKTWFSAIRENRLLVRAEGWAEAAVPTDSVLRAKAAVTPLDEAIACVKITKLLSRPPFESGETEAGITPQDFIDEAALTYVTRSGLSWASAHIQAAGTYRQQGNLASALDEFQAVEKVEGGNPMVQGLMGDLLVEMGDYARAESLLVRALVYEANPYLHYRLGVAKLMTERPQEAAEEIETALRIIREAGAQLDPTQMADVSYHLALAYAQMGRTEEARGILQTLVRSNMADSRAIELMAQLS